MSVKVSLSHVFVHKDLQSRFVAEALQAHKIPVMEPTEQQHLISKLGQALAAGDRARSTLDGQSPAIFEVSHEHLAKSGRPL